MGLGNGRTKNKMGRKYLAIFLLAVVVTVLAALIIRHFMDDTVLFWNLVIFAFVLLTTVGLFATQLWKIKLIFLIFLMIASASLVNFGLPSWIYLATHLPSEWPEGLDAKNIGMFRVKMITSAWIEYGALSISPELVAGCITDGTKCLASPAGATAIHDSEKPIAGKTIFLVYANPWPKPDQEISKIYYDIHGNRIANCSEIITKKGRQLRYPSALCRYLNRRAASVFDHYY